MKVNKILVRFFSRSFLLILNNACVICVASNSNLNEKVKQASCNWDVGWVGLRLLKKETKFPTLQLKWKSTLCLSTQWRSNPHWEYNRKGEPLFSQPWEILSTQLHSKSKPFLSRFHDSLPFMPNYFKSAMGLDYRNFKSPDTPH